MAINEYTRKMIGNSIGQTEVDIITGEVEWGAFMHIHVNKDISKPLL